MKKIISFVVVYLLLVQMVSATVKLASPFGEHMVLQRNMAVPIWGSAEPDENVTVVFNKQTITVVADKNGKWLLKLKPMKAGGPFTLTVNNSLVFSDVYVGEVWLCSGQSNMDMTVAKEDRYWCGVHNEAEEVANANYPLIRVFDVDYTPSDSVLNNVKGIWEICSPKTVGHFSAAAYFFAREIYRKYKVPVGLITTAYGASTAEAWISKKSLEANPLFTDLLTAYTKKKLSFDSASNQKKYADALAKWQLDSAKAFEIKKAIPKKPGNADPRRDQHNPYVLYNGMVSALIPYAIKGALWYQGESNGPSKNIYDKLMETLIKNWREDWAQGDFPFIYVQLANYGKSLDTMAGKGGNTTTIRDKQLSNLSIPNTAMVVAIDNADDPSNIHPKNKQAIGLRLALAAEAITYKNKVAFSGPIYKSMAVEASSIRLQFDYLYKGLQFKDGKPFGFAIAGKDKKFVWADARIEGKTIVVSSSLVTEPVAVRYAWGDNPLISLYNKANLPASPFKTDNW